MRYLLLLLLLLGCGPKKRELHIFGWSDSVPQESLEEFEDRFDCRIVYDTFDSNEAMYAKLKAGGASYDVIFPSSYIEPLLIKENLLHKLDHSKLKLDIDLFRAADAISEYSVPYMILYTGLGYRADRVPPQDSWRVFENVNYRGRMTLMNDLREVLGSALITLGYSANTRDPEKIEEAATLARTWRQNVAKFETEQYKQGLATAEFFISHGESGPVFQVQREDTNVQFVIPKEGGIVNYVQIAVMEETHELELAYALINFLYEPHISAKTMNELMVLVPNRAAYPLVTNREIFVEAEHVEKLDDLGDDLKLYLKAWERIKR